jgi:hypothetical protein
MESNKHNVRSRVPKFRVKNQKRENNRPKTKGRRREGLDSKDGRVVISISMREGTQARSWCGRQTESRQCRRQYQEENGEWGKRAQEAKTRGNLGCDLLCNVLNVS